jgi:hypothetical protein
MTSITACQGYSRTRRFKVPGKEPGARSKAKGERNGTGYSVLGGGGRIKKLHESYIFSAFQFDSFSMKDLRPIV